MPVRVLNELQQLLNDDDRKPGTIVGIASRQEREAPTVYDSNTTDVGITAILAYLRQTHGKRGRHGLPRAPWHLEICPTAICQVHCIFCSYEIRNRIGRTLKPETIEEVLADARELGVVGCYWSGGGDPLAAPEIDRLIEKSAEFSGTSVQTNAVSLSRLTRHGAAWFNRSLDLLSWSIYAHTEELFQKVCRARPGQFTRLVKNIREAVRLRDEFRSSQQSGGDGLPAVHLSGKLVVSRDSYEHLPEQLAFARELDLDTYHIRLVADFEPGQDVALSAKQRSHLAQILGPSADPLLQSLRKSLSPQPIMRTDCQPYSLMEGFNAIVETDGEVFLSIPSDGYREYSIGNVNRQRFRDIWGSQRHAEVVTRLKNEKRPPVTKDRHHKLDLSINDFLNGARDFALSPEMLTPANFRLHQRAQI